MGNSGEPEERSRASLYPAKSRAKLGKQVRPAVLGVLALSFLAGCVFPLLLWAIACPLFSRQAHGSLVRRAGSVIGSELIGQQFTRPEYFEPRPSAAGSGYDGTASGGTNLGLHNPKLVNGAADFAGIRQLAETYRRRNGLAPDSPVPIDAVTRSASGLDPHISVANAMLQAARVARCRKLEEAIVRRLVSEHIEGRALGFLGSPRVSVLELNLALDKLEAALHASR